MKPALQLAQALRKIASGVPLLSEEERQDVNDTVTMLERFAEFAEELASKGAAVRKTLRQAYGDTHRIMDRVGMAAKASTYDEEARRLRDITEGR